MLPDPSSALTVGEIGPLSQAVVLDPLKIMETSR